MTLVETDLLRRQAYVDGRWVDADSGETFPVINPATGRDDRRRVAHGRGGDAPGDRGGRPGAPRVAGANGQGARGRPAAVRRPITPWNFPSAMPTRKSAPALAAGCTMVVKPAEQTPLSALAVAALAEEAGIPPGVFSIVTGDAEDAPEIGVEMTSNQLVRKVGFTGSNEVGKLLMRQCSAGLKKISLELGGNAPFIVFDDADLEEAVAGAVLCKFRNSGQTCISANRILVQDGVHDDFLDRFTKAVAALKVGSGFDPETNVGPLIDEPALRKVERHVGDALDRAPSSSSAARGWAASSTSHPS